MNLDNQKRELLISLQEYLIRFMGGLNEIVLLFQQGEEQKSLEQMLDVIEGLAWISEAISLTQELYSTKLDIGKINEFLIQLNEALENNDTVQIADIIEYEIIPIVAEWNEVINFRNV